jgi:chloride channel protein, CIC family
MPSIIAHVQTLAHSAKLARRHFLRFRKGLALACRRMLNRIRENEVALIGIAAAIGFAVGIGVSIINGAVAWLHFILFGVPVNGHLSSGFPIPFINSFLGPAIGGLLVGLLATLIRYFRPREIVDVIEANALYGGRMSFWDSLNLTLLTVVAVGFGGSAGLEAAYTQAGSGFASKVGQNLRLRRQDLRLLVGCGAAAAIAAAFNSPLTGAFYAFELVIGSYTLQSLAPVASAALCGNLAIQAVSDNKPTFVLPGPVTLESHDYLLFLLLGLGAAAISIATMRAVTVVENSLRNRKIPGWLRPIIGGTAVGAVAVFYPEVLGSGHGAITHLLSGGFSMQPLTYLLIAKIVASALTVGSGMRGGLFSSSLFLGAVFGGAVSAALQSLAPHLGLNPVAYALVGMGAVAGGIVGAPVTMMLLVLETTGNFSLTIGVMAAVIACTVVVRQSFGYSFATWRFHVRGLRIRGAHDIGWIAELSAGRLMRRDVHLVPASETVAALREHFPLGGPKYAFVVDDGGAYLGTIETIEAHSTAFERNAGEVTAAGLIHEEPRALTPDQNIHAALLMFTKTAQEVLPVVESAKTRRIVGLVSEAYLLRRYSQELEKQRVEETNGGVFSPESPTI